MAVNSPITAPPETTTATGIDPYGPAETPAKTPNTAATNCITAPNNMIAVANAWASVIYLLVSSKQHMFFD